MMPELSESTWLRLPEAADLISRKCGCSIEDAREAIVCAIRDSQVPARGTRPNPVYKQASAQGFPGGFGGPDWDRNYPPQVGRPLKPELFLQHNLDWQTNTLGEFSDVEINRVLLLQWLGGVEGVQNPNEAAPKDGDPPSQTEQAKQETKTKHADPTVDGPTKGKAGRKLGSGSYESHDKPLLEEMKTLINDGAASSIYGAALLVASRAKGGGGEQSKAKRLARRFQESDIAD